MVLTAAEWGVGLGGGSKLKYFVVILVFFLDLAPPFLFIFFLDFLFIHSFIQFPSFFFFFFCAPLSSCSF